MLSVGGCSALHNLRVNQADLPGMDAKGCLIAVSSSKLQALLHSSVPFRAPQVHVPGTTDIGQQVKLSVLLCRALWGACEELAAHRGVTAELHTRNVASVAQLQHEHGPFSGTVVAAGAAAGFLPEIGVPASLLPQDLFEYMFAHCLATRLVATPPAVCCTPVLSSSTTCRDSGFLGKVVAGTGTCAEALYACGGARASCACMHGQRVLTAQVTSFPVTCVRATRWTWSPMLTAHLLLNTPF